MCAFRFLPFYHFWQKGKLLLTPQEPFFYKIWPEKNSNFWFGLLENESSNKTKIVKPQNLLQMWRGFTSFSTDFDFLAVLLACANEIDSLSNKKINISKVLVWQIIAVPEFGQTNPINLYLLEFF